MQQSLLFNPQSLLLNNHVFFQFSSTSATPQLQWRIRTSHLVGKSIEFSPCFNSPEDECRKRTHVIVARKGRRRTGTRRSGKAFIESALLIASNLKLLPEPVNFIIREGLGGGGKGGGGIGRGGGSSNGFGWGWFDGNRRNLGFLRMFLGLGALVMLLTSKNQFEGFGDLGFGVLGMFLVGTADRGLRRGIKGWVFGFCSCAFMVLLGLRKKELQRWVQGFRAPSPVLDFVRRQRRRRRRIF